MKRLLLVLLLSVGTALAQYPGETTPRSNDTQNLSTSKINRLLNDAKTGDSPLSVTGTVTTGLPTGAATEAKQDAGNTTLSAIETEVGAINNNTDRDGQQTMAGSIPVVLPSDQSAIPVTAAALTPAAYTSSATLTRPNDTDAYAALDVISTSASAGTVLTFASAGPSGGRIMLTGAWIEWDDASLPSGAATFRLHLYDASPTAINDNAAFDLPSGDRAKYLGYIDLPTAVDLGATLWQQDDSIRKQLKLASASTSLYGILQTIASYTPAASSVRKIGLRAVKLAD